jgi:hypothetical protein
LAVFEDELKTTIMGTASYQHKFKEAGHVLNVGLTIHFTEKMKIFL